MLPLVSIAFQVVLLLLNPIATITLVPVARDLSLTTTMMAIEPGTATGGQIPARRLPPLTLTQTKTALATGKRHQDAEAAMGTITFYNGLFTSQTIAAGTTLTGSDGVQVITDQLAVIPAATSRSPKNHRKRSMAWIPWSKVTDVLLTQTLAGRILGYATVRIESANEASGFKAVTDLRDPHRFHRVVTEMVQAKQGKTVPPWMKPDDGGGIGAGGGRGPRPPRPHPDEAVTVPGLPSMPLPDHGGDPFGD